MSLREEIIKDLAQVECDLGNPTFTWNGTNYNFIPSISEFQKELDKGFRIVKLLTATVRKYRIDDENNIIPLFINGYPTAKNIITYSLDNTNYRIESVKHDPTNSSLRIICHSTTSNV